MREEDATLDERVASGPYVGVRDGNAAADERVASGLYDRRWWLAFDGLHRVL